MGEIATLGATFLQDSNIAGVPASGPRNPPKSEGRTVFQVIDDKVSALEVGSSDLAPRVTALEGEVDALQIGQSAGTYVFATKAQLDAFLTPGANAKAEVYADSTPANNGVYQKVGATGTGSWTKISDLAVTSLDADLTFQATKTDLLASQEIVFKTPMVVQRDYDGSQFLGVPSGYAFRSDSGFVAFDPVTLTGNSGQSRVWQILSNSPSAVAFHIYNLTTTPPANPIIVNGPGPSPVEGYNYVLLGSSCNDRIDGAYAFVGEAYGNVSQNTAAFTVDARAAPVVYNTTAFTPFISGSISGRGITQGFNDPTTHVAAVGDFVPDGAGDYPYCFFRLWVETATADDFGSPKYYFKNRAGAVVGGGFLVLERKFSSTVAVFSVAVKYAGADPLGGYLVGNDTTAAPALAVINGGVQAAFDDQPIAWVDWFDRAGAIDAAVAAGLSDATADLVIPPDMFVFAEQSTTLFLRAGLPDLPDGVSAECAISAIAPVPGPLPILASGADNVSILPEEVGDYTGEVMLRKPSRGRSLWRAPVTIHAVEKAQSGAVRVMMLGDSLTNRFVPEAVSLRLAKVGMTPTMVGTIQAFHRTATAYLGEGREGRRFSHYTYELATSDCAPVAVGDEAVYMAKTNVEKMAFNPFLRVATGADPSDQKFNGYIFDLGFYLTRFSITAPDCIVIKLGANDIGAATYSTIVTGLRVLYQRIRAYSPTMKIAFAANTVAKAGVSPTIWDTYHRYLVREIQKFVRAQADTNLSFLAHYLRQSPDTGWPVLATSTDAATGLITGGIDDTSSATVNGVTYGLGGSIHPLDINVQAEADQVAAWVAYHFGV
jgi:hypothetical protein